MSLRVNRARENFDSGNPDLNDFERGAIGGRELSRFDAGFCDALSERRNGIIAFHEAGAYFRRKALPSIGLIFVHEIICLTKSRRALARDWGCNRDRAPNIPANVPGSLRFRALPRCAAGRPIRGDTVWRTACKQSDSQPAAFSSKDPRR